jgi:Zn ribbon nucleic-acid-binding protein
MNDKCPRCDYKKLKSWSELSEDEKMLIRAKSKGSFEEIKTRRFCVRCGFEEIWQETKA